MWNGSQEGVQLGRMSLWVALSNFMKSEGPGTLEATEKGEEAPAEPGTCLSIFLPGTKTTRDKIPRCA